MNDSREKWQSKIGLILAMTGNIVGLGSFWRFPYQVASNGAGTFMIPYFAALLILAIPLILVECSLGRYGGKYGHATLGPMVYIQAREGATPKKSLIIASICGSLAFAVTLLVNSYYNHIIGWTLGYGVQSLTYGYVDATKTTAQIFAEYIQNPSMVFTFWIISLLCLAFAGTRGIQKAIEYWAKIMIPLIYVFGIILAIKALTLGSPVNPDWSVVKGLDFIWNPDFSSLTWGCVLSAIGQIFFTLSIGMGIICNYASYLKPEDDMIVASLTSISLNEFAEVVLAGTIVIPVAYAFLGPQGIGSGIGLTFIAHSNVFRNMAGGSIFGAMWFFLLFFVGFTSAIAMYNYLVTSLEKDMNLTKKRASVVMFVAYLIVGLPIALEPILTKTDALVYFAEIDKWVGNYLIIVLALIEILVVAYLMGNKAKLEMNNESICKIPNWFFNLFIKFLSPLCLMVVLFFSTIDYFKAGYFKLVPSFVESTPHLVIWVQLARCVIAVAIVFGFVQSYKSIKNKYANEIEENKIGLKL